MNDFQLENEKFLAELLQTHNIDPNDKQPGGRDFEDPPQRVLFRAQAIFRALGFPDDAKLINKCKCGAVYTSNYKNFGRCSTECDELALKAHFKKAWRPLWTIKRERWEIREEPQMIPQGALIAMKNLVMAVEKQLGYSIPTESGESAGLPDLLTPETLQRSLQNSPTLAEDSEQLRIQAQKSYSSHIPEQSVLSEQSDSNLEDWLFEE